MRNIISKVMTIFFAAFIMINLFSVTSSAVENGDITSVMTNQADQPNVGQVYVNEPLDNAVPVIYKYEVGGNGYIIPGEAFTLKFTIYNPGVVSKISNVIVDISQSDSLVYPMYGSTNSVFIGYLSALSYSEGEITLIASKDINEKEIPLSINVTYTDNYSTSNQLRLVATLPVSSSGKLSLSSVDVPSTMYVGNNNRLSISYRNSGLSTINDVVLNLSGESINEQKISLGSIGSNSSLTSDIYVEFIQTGQQAVDISFTYTDSDGQIKQTEPVEYSFDVKNYETEINDEYAQYMYKRNTINRYMTIGVLMVCTIIIIIACARIYKEKNLSKKTIGGRK